MSQARIAKSEVIEKLKDKLAKAKLAAVVDYRGLTVAQISDLRRKLKDLGGELLVAKNTLILLALGEKEAAKGLTEALNGPTAVVFSPDELSVPKALVTFAKSTGLPAIKAAVMNDRVLSAEEVKALAAIPGREVLNGKLVNLLASQPQRLVQVLNGNLIKLAYVLDGIRKAKS